ncbi:MAG: glycogen phosphorylase [Waddliaceae bacterium]|nr:glycogen phosphorylase [Waddliaceae bacterium]
MHKDNIVSPRDRCKVAVPSPSIVDNGVDALRDAFTHHMHYTLAKDKYTATRRDCYHALVMAVRDRLVSRWMETQQQYYNTDSKRVYYLSLEFLVGRTLGNSLINLGIYKQADQMLEQLGLDLEEIREVEWDAGLGNGGLGRLAACFLDSMATLGIPGFGYGIRYQYGIFNQQIKDGYQHEQPDNWLRYGNPWEIVRPEYLYPVQFYGRVERYCDEHGVLRHRWVDTSDVMAMAYDTPVPGYGNGVVNTMRLWEAKSSRGFELTYFNHGDYMRAVEDKNATENISRVLYPNDNQFEGKELRLKQEYFLVAATLQDIMRRFSKTETSMAELPDKVAIQLNDTHPSLAVPELMRILLDDKGLEWEKAWEITNATCAYTNHTILPEALEKWPVEMMRRLLPRHLEIIYEVNRRFLNEVSLRFPENEDRLEEMSLIEEGGEKKVRMANLCIHGCHSINGVSALHTNLLTSTTFAGFHALYPNRFNNKTNGITPRRWLAKANPGLAALITETIGDGWVTDLSQLSKLEKYADKADFQEKWAAVKQQNKKVFAHHLRQTQGIEINPNSLFDCQIKRMHEYKRQLLLVMYAIHMYNTIKDNPEADILPRTIMIGGKAAPGYFMAKLIIKLIHSVADKINNDPVVGERLRLVFLENYRVSLAEKVIPASELSEQISTAGMEASGTGNMKFALNGALTIGTLDGANVEIREEVGEDNIFIFGLTTEEVQMRKNEGYNPWDMYHSNANIQRVMDMIQNGYFSPEQWDMFRPIVEAILHGGDHYMVLADFQSYIDAQERVAKAYRDEKWWIKSSILNVARSGKFSSDRTIMEYAKEIWNVNPMHSGNN